ncbi:MAG: histidine phosphatase [Proteobacteria bacterium]|nr:MAG: histidine phosphatase [Pseudomonadota bacterium]
MSDLLRLTLVRHAEAEAAPFGTEDRVRALTQRGRHEAHAMSRRLRARHTPPDKLLSSPAERAWMTAVIFGRELGVAPADIERDERLYLASAARLLEVIRSAGASARHLMVFGHNPGICELADGLGDRGVPGMPTCAVYTLEFAAPGWHELEWASGMHGELDWPRQE